MVCVGCILGVDCMCEMMLIGCNYGVEDGLKFGFVYYVVEVGEGLFLVCKFV